MLMEEMPGKVQDCRLKMVKMGWECRDERVK